MADPRAENCRSFTAPGGKVTGVDLDFHSLPDSKYELLKVELIDEESSQGQTVAFVTVEDKNGLPAQVRVWMAFPYSGNLPSKFDHKLPPGHNKTPYEHMITNGYDPPGKGPLAIFVGDNDGNFESDVIAGIGLPFKHHIGFRMFYRERTELAGGGGGGGGEEEPGDPGGPEVPSDIASQLQRIEDKLDRLSEHFGIDN